MVLSNITVTNFITQCSSDAVVGVSKTSVPQEIISVTPTHVDVCLPMAVNGAGTVTDVRIGATIGQAALFSYTWDTNATITTPL